MSGFAWTLPAAASSATAPSTRAQAQVDRFYGRDIHFGIDTGDYEVTAAGDWLVVSGREALRQALHRRIITEPGEWQTLPDYGAGAGSFVRARDTAANRDQLAGRIRAQLAAETRVARVDAVTVERPQEGVLVVAATITPRGRLAEGGALTVQLEVT